MSKEGRVRGGRGSGSKSAAAGGGGGGGGGSNAGPVPYSTITRRERSRKLAQKRRDIYKQIMDDMTSVRMLFLINANTHIIFKYIMCVHKPKPLLDYYRRPRDHTKCPD